MILTEYFLVMYPLLLLPAVCQGTGTLWNKSSFKDIGMWDEKLLLWQDIELHLRSLLKPLHYQKRLDLKPDVFLRISEVSLSRTAFHSYPKFQSRVQVLRQTFKQASQRGLVQKHKIGLQAMFADLLVNAANSNYKSDIQDLFDLQYQYDLFEKHELKRLKHYVFLRKSKLYRIPFLQQRAFQNLYQKASVFESTLNKVLFNEHIII